MAGLEIARVLQESIRDLRREMELMRGEIRALKEQVERTSVPALDFGDEVEEKQEKPRKTGRDILLENMDKFLDL
jgi:predicted  nucleic acid-binding Zn-ribbon protein